MGQATDEAGRVWGDGEVGGTVDLPASVRGEKRADHSLVLLGFEGAGGIDEPPARLDH